jgi:hypothetical protein
MYGNSICSNLVKLANGQPLVTPPPTPVVPVSAACGLQVASHDATIIADGSVCGDLKTAYPPAGGGVWDDYNGAGPPTYDSLVCSGQYEEAQVQVWDSGGQYYGSDLCQRLGWPTR